MYLQFQDDFYDFYYNSIMINIGAKKKIRCFWLHGQKKIGGVDSEFFLFLKKKLYREYRQNIRPYDI